MKIAFVVKYYDAYIDYLENKIDDFELLSYDSLIEKINQDYFIMYNSYTNYLNKIPNVECKLIIPNWHKLQKKWKTGMFISGVETSIEQIKEFSPDILFVNSNFEYYYSIIPHVKNNVKKIATWISCPLPEKLDLSNIDHVFTLFPPHFHYFKSIGIHCTLTTAGFDANILKVMQNKKNKYSLSFVGGIGAFHNKRERYLKFLIKRTDIQLWGYGFVSKNVFKNLVKQIFSRFIYFKRYKGNAWGIKMFEIINDSKITFNCHGDIAKDHAVNMRLFEATGVGTLLITEYSKNIEEFFVPGQEIVCYTTEQDALEKIQYYLKNDIEREKIAEAGQKKVLEKYNYEKLSLELYRKFEELLKS